MHQSGHKADKLTAVWRASPPGGRWGTSREVGQTSSVEQPAGPAAEEGLSRSETTRPTASSSPSCWAHCCSQTARRQSTGREKVTGRAYKAAAAVHRHPEWSQLEERRWQAGLTRLLLLFTDSQKAVNWKRESDRLSLQGCCCCSQTDRRRSTGREKVTGRAYKAAATVHRQPEGSQLEERKWQVELTRLLLLFTDSQKAVNWKRESDRLSLQGCCCCSQTARRQSTGREKVTCRAYKAAATVHRQPEGSQLEERRWHVGLTRLLLLFTDRQKAVNWKREGDRPLTRLLLLFTDRQKAVNWKREGDRPLTRLLLLFTDRQKAVNWKREGDRPGLQGCCCCSQTDRRRSTGREKVTGRAYKAATDVHRQPEGSQLEERRWQVGLTRLLLLLFTDRQKAVNWKREGDRSGLQGCYWCSQTDRRQSTGREKVTGRAYKAATDVHRQPEGSQLEERRWQVGLTRLLLLFTDRQKAVNWKREGDRSGLQGCYWCSQTPRRQSTGREKVTGRAYKAAAAVHRQTEGGQLEERRWQAAFKAAAVILYVVTRAILSNLYSKNCIEDTINKYSSTN